MADVYLTIRPNQELTLAHIWRTSIQNIYNGNEKRSMLFTWPRLSMEGTFSLPNDQRINWFKRHLIRNDDLVWGVPVWPDETSLSSQAASGQPILNVATTSNGHFYVGRECIIIDEDDFLFYEIGVIQSMTSTSITFTTNLAETWATGSIVLPVYDFRMEVEQEIEADFRWFQSISLKFMENYDTLKTYTYTLPVSGAPTYLTYDIFLHELLNPVKYKFKRPFDALQTLGIGYYIHQLEAGKNFIKLTASALYNTKESMWDLLEFFDSKQGRLVPFWVPTWSKDVVATSAILASDTVINIENISYTSFYLPNEIIGRFIYIQFPNKAYVCRKIVDSSISTITLDSAIGTAVSTIGLLNLNISFLMLCRFDIDTLGMEYIDNNMVKTDLVFSGLLDYIELPS